MRSVVVFAGALLLIVALGASLPGASEDPEGAPVVRASPAYDRDGNRIFDDLDARLETMAPFEAVDVIVVFTAVDLARGLEALEAEVGPLDPSFEYPSLPGLALALTRDEVIRVAGLHEVRQVEQVVDGEPELASSTYYIGARAVWTDLGYTGDLDGDPDSFSKDDVTIAVLDTGIHPGHADLAGKIIGWHDTVSGQPTPYDPNGHGTHVASIAAGMGTASEEHRGVAPGASLVGVRISNKAHAGAAVEWVISNCDVYGIDIMTMSFGFGIGADGTDSLSLLFDKAFEEAGILTVKSTGNSGPNHGTMTIPGDARHILAVGSIEDPGKSGWKLATYSSRGPTSDGRIKPDIAAPGHSITAASVSAGGYVTYSGTSMAAPHVAGVAALVLSAAPDLTNAQLRQLLLDTAVPRGMGDGTNNDYGWGLVDPYAAVQAATNGTGTNPVASPSVFTWSAQGSGLLTVQLGARAIRIPTTILLDAPAGQRGFTLSVYGGSGVPFTYIHPAGGPRHVNVDIPVGTLAGNVPPHAIVFDPSSAGHPYSLDLSGAWPEDPPSWHGQATPLP